MLSRIISSAQNVSTAQALDIVEEVVSALKLLVGELHLADGEDNAFTQQLKRATAASFFLTGLVERFQGARRAARMVAAFATPDKRTTELFDDVGNLGFIDLDDPCA